MTTSETVRPGWGEALSVYFHRRVMGMLFLGFSAGMPYSLVDSTLSRWLREAGVSRTAVGFVSWVGLAFAFKFAWAPIVDRLPLPWLDRLLGRRRSWMLLAQLTIAGCIFAMSRIDPAADLEAMVIAAVALAFAAATQDIAIDAYRIEAVDDRYQGAMAATYVYGYRLALLLAGAGALSISYLARDDPEHYDIGAWSTTYVAMAACMLIGVVTTLLIREPEVERLSAPTSQLDTVFTRVAKWVVSAVIMPFVDFFRRLGWRALLVLAIVAIYRIADVVLGKMAQPFYEDLGFTALEVAAVSKFYGFAMTLVGLGLGGILIVRFGVIRILLVAAVLAAATNLLFAELAFVGRDLTWLTVAISADNLAGGMAMGAFIAFMSSMTNVAYSATQYALFSSLMSLVPKTVAGFGGMFVDTYAYPAFFATTAVMGVPVLLLIALGARYLPSRA